MSLSDLEDRLAITDLVNRSVAGVMRKDLALWGGTWAEDGSWMIDMFDEPMIGRDKIVGIFGSIVEKFAFVAMSSFVTDLDIDGDRATGKA
jgi:ketosteroid isomerase-like protein